MQEQNRNGTMYALLAYTMWGFAPIYFKALEGFGALEVVSHRVIWSFALLFILLSARVGWQPLRQLLRQPRKLGWLAISSILIAFNWLLFIWAVTAERMLDASLGYYINPLVNVVLGTIFLSERLARMQWIAVVMAAIGVLIQTISFGSVPWIALALAVSFGLYGLIRKRVTIDGISGLWIETLLMLPLAIGYVISISPNAIPMSSYSANETWLLVAAGIVTTAPLICFIAAAKRMSLSLLGFFQYIGPSLMFILAATVYGEPVTNDKLITFAFIWLALLIFSWHGWFSYQHRRGRQSHLREI